MNTALTNIADEANRSHRQAELKAREAITHALEAGRLLAEAKASVGHGGWRKWLEANFEGSTRTAQAYMRLARHWPELEAKAQSSAHLSIDGALQLLAESKPKDTASPPPENNGQDSPPESNGQPPAHTATDTPHRPASTPAVPQPSEPDPAPEDEPNPEDYEPDLAHELQVAYRENERLEQLVASLTKSDLGAEIASWQERYAQLEGRLRAEITTCNEAKRSAQYYSDLVKNMRRAAGVVSNKELLPALTGLADSARKLELQVSAGNQLLAEIRGALGVGSNGEIVQAISAIAAKNGAPVARVADPSDYVEDWV